MKKPQKTRTSLITEKPLNHPRLARNKCHSKRLLAAVDEKAKISVDFRDEI